MTATSKIPTRKFDVVIVGAGGSGMRASLQLAIRFLCVLGAIASVLAVCRIVFAA